MQHRLTEKQTEKLSSLNYDEAMDKATDEVTKFVEDICDKYNLTFTQKENVLSRLTNGILNYTGGTYGGIHRANALKLFNQEM